MPGRLKAFFAELRRRHVYQVAAVYVAVGLGVLGAAELILDPLGLGAARPFIVVITLLGFPIAVVLAWAYEKTPEGIVRDESGATADGEAVVQAPFEVADGRKSIVVLPFDNMSPDPNDAYFSDGLTEEIITQLSCLKSLKVISRNSAMALKDTKKNTRQIGEELKVGYVMEGSVRRAGNDLRITAQLIDAASDEHLWAETYARELEDVFEVQTDIALSVAEAMKASLDRRGVERIESRPTDNLSAHEAYLLGRHHWWSFTPEGQSRAKDYFDRALELDPNYALAHSGLAYMYVVAGGGGVTALPMSEAYPMAKAAALKALSLDSELGEAHGALSLVHLWFEWDWAHALEAAREGVEIEPNSSFAWGSYAYALGLTGRAEESVQAGRRFVELDPLAALAHQNLGLHLFNARRPDEARLCSLRALELDPDNCWGRLLLADIALWQGNPTEALEHLEPLLGMVNQSMNVAISVGSALGALGRLKECHDIAMRLTGLAEEDRASWVAAAVPYVWSGEHARALDYFSRVPDQRPPPENMPSFIGVWPGVDPIRDHPRFQAVLKRMGLPSKSQIQSRHA